MLRWLESPSLYRSKMGTLILKQWTRHCIVYGQIRCRMLILYIKKEVVIYSCISSLFHIVVPRTLCYSKNSLRFFYVSSVVRCQRCVSSSLYGVGVYQMGPTHRVTVTSRVWSVREVEKDHQNESGQPTSSFIIDPPGSIGVGSHGLGEEGQRRRKQETWIRDQWLKAQVLKSQHGICKDIVPRSYNTMQLASPF